MQMNDIKQETLFSAENTNDSGTFIIGIQKLYTWFHYCASSDKIHGWVS